MPDYEQLGARFQPLFPAYRLLLPTRGCYTASQIHPR
jgi:hypothetical protein